MTDRPQLDDRKLCIRCKHHESPQTWAVTCNHPDLIQTSPVDGNEHGADCQAERSFGKLCGKEGLLWERVT